MPPINETGEIEQDLGLTPVTTPITDTDALDTSGEDEASQSSSGQDNDQTADEPKSMAEAIAAALAGDDDKDPDKDPEDGEKPDSGEPKTEDAKPDAAAAKTPDTDKSKAPAGETADKDEEDPSEDELKAYQPKVQKRIRKLLSQRNEYRHAAEEATTDATHYRNIRQFMTEAKLQDGEVAELFEVGRLLKGNDIAGFEKALDIVLPIAQQLLEMTGRSIPSDLREKVESGELTEDHARELARQRTRAETAERRATEVEKTVQTREQQANVSAVQTAIKTAVSTWEQRTRQSDPDFGLKADAMRDAALAMVAEKGPPKNPQEAVQFAQEAYDRVGKWFRAARPAAKPSKPAPGTGQNGNRSGLAPAPTSLKEAVLGALRSPQS